MIYHSSCKINIGLDVISKRDDGFHNIESLMFPVLGLYDEIEVVPRRDNDIIFSQQGIAVDCLVEDNLCVRAYKLLMKDYGIAGADISINKKIPFGAGLGGGSSNASFILKAAVEAYGLSVSPERLVSLARKLGSDTAFFIYNRPALVSGRGDELSLLDISLDGYFLTLIKPNININTKKAYSGITPFVPQKRITDILKGKVEDWHLGLKNDFEKHIFEKNPLLLSIKKSLYDKGALLSMMSGSGSTMYAISKEPIDTTCFEPDMFVFSEHIKSPRVG
ncbi:MAG: 4-(cytidine 5'-diphospho)-2-C-methyl-D-erythritol kinase [Rikenellaceae bacterium]